jgi:hypothetical protein
MLETSTWWIASKPQDHPAVVQHMVSTEPSPYGKDVCSMVRHIPRYACLFFRVTNPSWSEGGTVPTSKWVGGARMKMKTGILRPWGACSSCSRYDWRVSGKVVCSDDHERWVAVSVGIVRTWTSRLVMMNGLWVSAWLGRSARQRGWCDVFGQAMLETFGMQHRRARWRCGDEREFLRRSEACLLGCCIQQRVGGATKHCRLCWGNRQDDSPSQPTDVGKSRPYGGSRTRSAGVSVIFCHSATTDTLSHRPASRSACDSFCCTNLT